MASTRQLAEFKQASTDLLESIGDYPPAGFEREYHTRQVKEGRFGHARASGSGRYCKAVRTYGSSDTYVTMYSTLKALDRPTGSRRVVATRSLANAVLLLMVCLQAAAQDPVNLFPGIEGDFERLRFHTGRTANNQAEISTDLPNIPGPESRWTLMQWSQPQVILPDSLTIDDPATRDERLGLARYAFTAPDGHSHMWIYQDPISRHPVYELYERGGALSATGGANIFLASDAPTGGISLEHELLLEVDARLTKAAVKANPTAQQQGVVLAQAFSGFVIQFPGQDGGALSTLFLQIPIARSISSRGEYRSCNTRMARRTIIFGALPEVTSYLPFEVDRNPLRHLRYNISSYVCALRARPIMCADSKGRKTSWSVPVDVNGFRDWKIVRMYIGLETEIQDIRARSESKDPQGQVEVALQIGNLRVTPDHRRDFTLASCANRTP